MKLLLTAVLVVASVPQAYCQSQTKPAVPDYGADYNTPPPPPASMVAPTTGPRCPWMNLGTAGGLLGGEVTVNLIKDAAGDVRDCGFTRMAAPGELAIQVTASEHKQLASELCATKPIPLRAVGNEAIECRASGAALVMGRVRDQDFLIRLSGQEADTAARHAREAAEQVAGNLF